MKEREIETIRERKIMLKLSDADCEKISNLCGKHNIKIADLLESFIGDLVGGTHTNGSDERDFARRYFERCWFGMYPDKTLLNYLLSEGELDDLMNYLETIEEMTENIESAEKDIKNADELWDKYVIDRYNEERTSCECVPAHNSVEEFIKEKKEEIEFDKNDLNDALENIKEIQNGFNEYMGEESYVWEEELEKVNEWWKEKERLKNPC